MTAGEIAGMIRAREGLDVELTVVELRGWSRSLFYDQTGLPWVMPSPNMPTLDTALVYPGMCLVEGTELSEGRGTTRPFELCGAPFLDGHAWAEAAQHEVGHDDGGVSLHEGERAAEEAREEGWHARLDELVERLGR